MHYQVKLLATALAAGLGVAAMLATSAGSASADTAASLSITSFYQIVADPAHGHLFISPGSGSDIIVTDLTGQQVAAIGSQDGVLGIALSPDGTTLYAALTADDAVSAIDTSTLQETASYSIGSGNTPRDVAVQSGKVWVSYDTGVVGQAAIGDIDLSATTPAFGTQANMGAWYSAPALAADPQDTSGVVVAVQPGIAPAEVTSYDVSVEPATVRATSSLCAFEYDLAVVPGGSKFILPCSPSAAANIYSTADLSIGPQGSYAATSSADAVAIAANGDVAVGTSDGQDGNPDAYVYQPDGTLLNSFSLNSSGNTLRPRGLSWSADESQLYAVLQSPSNAYYLQVIDNPTLTRSLLSLTAPSSIYVTHSVTLTGELALSAGGNLPAGTPITITRSVTGGTSASFKVFTAADGGFSLTDKPPAAGQYTYTASYAGSSTTAASAAPATVTVKRLPTSLSVSTDHAIYNYDATIHVTAHLGTTYTNRTVAIYAQSLRSTRKKLLASGRVNSHGNLTVSYVAPHSTTFSAVFAGDARYVPATAKRTVGVRVKVTMKLGGYYGTTSVNGRTYKLYHHTAHLDVTVTVTPNKRGQCVVIQVQEYFRGAWHTVNAIGCIALNRYSKVSGYLLVDHADRNIPYRIRAEYFRSTIDVSNLNNHSGWQYLKVEQ